MRVYAQVENDKGSQAYKGGSKSVAVDLQLGRKKKAQHLASIEAIKDPKNDTIDIIVDGKIVKKVRMFNKKLREKNTKVGIFSNLFSAI